MWVSVAGFGLIVGSMMIGGAWNLVHYQRYRRAALNGIKAGRLIEAQHLSRLGEENGFFPRWASMLAGAGVVLWLGGAAIVLLT